MKWMCQKCKLKKILDELPTQLDQDPISILLPDCPLRQKLYCMYFQDSMFFNCQILEINYIKLSRNLYYMTK